MGLRVSRVWGLAKLSPTNWQPDIIYPKLAALGRKPEILIWKPERSGNAILCSIVARPVGFRSFLLRPRRGAIGTFKYVRRKAVVVVIGYLH